MAVNLLDVILVGIALSAAIAGCRKGLALIISTWLGLVLGLVVALGYYDDVRRYLMATLGQAVMAGGTGHGAPSLLWSALLGIISFVLVVMLVSMLIRVLGRVVTSAVENIGLRWLNGLLGAIVYCGLIVGIMSLLLGILLPLLEMAAGAGLSWALTAEQAVQKSWAAAFLLNIYGYWGLLLK